MTDETALGIVRGVHTAIYLAMVAAIGVLWYSAIVGYHGVWLALALVMLSIESVVFLGNGMRCPLTALAVHFGAEKGYAFDTFLPERVTRHTFRVFGVLMVLGLVALTLRAVGALG